MKTPSVRSPPSYSAVYTYGTRCATRGATACRTELMCHPVTPCTAPAATSASTSAATLDGSAPPSTSRSRSSRPRTPPAALTSSTASRAHASHPGPKIPAGPCIGYTSATFSTDASTVNHSGVRRCADGSDMDT